MRTFVQNIIIKSVVCLLIVLMTLLVVNNALFTHMHRFTDGTVIIHAHPYNKTADKKPFKTHHHTQKELQFFAARRIFFPVVFLKLMLDNFEPKPEPLYVCFFAKKIFSVDLSVAYGRAPPLKSPYCNRYNYLVIPDKVSNKLIINIDLFKIMDFILVQIARLFVFSWKSLQNDWKERQVAANEYFPGAAGSVYQ